MRLDPASPSSDEPVWAHAPVASPGQIPRTFDALGIPTSYERNQEIYCQESPVECWYRLVSGTARRFALRSDGRRQVVDLLLPGDLFGFGIRGTHAFSAEAIADGAVISRYPTARISALGASDPAAAQEILELVLASIARLHSLLLILGRSTAQGKLGGFLLLMQRRIGGDSAGRLTLPLSRYDLADYLSLSVETVSRALTDLKQRGAIALSGPRQIGIIDRDALLDRRDAPVAAPASRKAEPRHSEAAGEAPRETPWVRTVEVRVSSFAFAEALNNMRSWFDHQRCEPSRFTCARETSGAVAVRVEFPSDNEQFAAAFEDEFSSLSGSAAVRP